MELKAPFNPWANWNDVESVTEQYKHLCVAFLKQYT